MGAAMRCTTGCCCTPTVIAKFTVGGCRWNQPRLARGVCEGPSRMQGNLPVRFRGEEVRATSPPYPTVLDTVVSEKRSGLLSRFPRPPTRTQTGLQSQALSRLLHPDQLPERPATP